MEETLRAMAAVRPDVLMLSAIPDYRTLLLAAQLASSRLVIAQATAASAARGLVALRDWACRRSCSRARSAWSSASAWSARSAGSAGRRPSRRPTQTLEAHGIDRDEAQALSFFKGKGCPTCNTIGYRGRRAIFEAIPASPEVRSALERGRTAEEIEAAAIESGMITIRERALGLVKAGVTTFDEFARLRL